MVPPHLGHFLVSILSISCSISATKDGIIPSGHDRGFYPENDTCIDDASSNRYARQMSRSDLYWETCLMLPPPPHTLREEFLHKSSVRD